MAPDAVLSSCNGQIDIGDDRPAGRAGGDGTRLGRWLNVQGVGVDEVS